MISKAPMFLWMSYPFLFLNRPSNQQWKRVVTWYMARQLKVLSWHYFSPCSVLFALMLCCALAFTRLTQKQKTKKWTHRQDELWVRCRREWCWMQCPHTTWWKIWWPYHSPTPGTCQIYKAVSGILTHKTILTLMGEVGRSNQQTSSVASHRPSLDPQRSETWYVRAPAHYKCSLASPKLKRSRWPAVPQT